MSHYHLMQGDNRQTLKALPDNSVDSIVTDPPYELGFMGKSWDASGIAYDKAMWAECLRVLKPGGHLLAFSGSRTYHRMTCAIEDAGFEVRDQIMWVYGSGFPKSHNISKALDKQAGVEQEVVGRNPNSRENCDKSNTLYESGIVGKTDYITAPATEAAKQWDGWGTALKPAHEPICLARKPLDGTVANNVLTWGVGGLNIDGCRVGYNSEEDKENAHYNALGMERLKIENGEKLGSFDGGWKKHKPTLPTGRFPANFIHDGSQQVLDLFPAKAGAAAPVKSGHSGEARNGIYNDYEQRGDDGATFYGDSGSAARFFYCPKASKHDRDQGCEDLTDKEWKTEGAAIPERENRPFIPSKNNHPTVKPTELMRYLCRLITPSGGTILDPFMGSGSTGKAAMLEGFKFIGCELSEDYIKIAEARIKTIYDPRK